LNLAAQRLRGEVGLVYFSREVLPFSYHGDPEKTRRVQHPDHPNWGTTGDVDDLPRIETSKLQEHELRDRYAGARQPV
jgi:hypothetical protein